MNQRYERMGSRLAGRWTILLSAAILSSACGNIGEPCDETGACVAPASGLDAGAAAGCASDDDCTFPRSCEELGVCNLETGRCEYPLKPAGEVCRAAEGSCDLAEVCDGVSPSCPADEIHPEGVGCVDEVGLCELARFCDGVSKACPDPDVLEAGTVCRPSEGACDVNTCDGESGTCPTEEVLGSDVVCRAATLPCDLEERCGGKEKSCPVDKVAKAGDPCIDGNPCTAEVCDGVGKTCPPLPDNTQCQLDNICCGGTCVFPGSSNAHCGACGNFCIPPAVCVQGQCKNPNAS